MAHEQQYKSIRVLRRDLHVTKILQRYIHYAFLSEARKPYYKFITDILKNNHISHI